jgi:hypothetical protein
MLQIIGDLLVIGWILLWSLAGIAVHHATVQIAEPGYRVASASTSLSERLHASGRAVGRLPVVGDAAATPLVEAGAAAGQLADAGRAEVRALTHQPLHRLAAISEDPAAAWCEQDTETVDRLAALELASLGLRPNRTAPL